MFDDDDGDDDNNDNNNNNNNNNNTVRKLKYSLLSKHFELQARLANRCLAIPGVINKAGRKIKNRT